MPARRVMQSRRQERGPPLRFGGHRLTQRHLHLQVSVAGALRPPTPVRRAAAPNRKPEEKSAQYLERGLPIREAVVDLTAVQKPVLAPNQTPLQAVAHRSLPRSGFRPRHCLCDWAAVCGAPNFKSRGWLRPAHPSFLLDSCSGRSPSSGAWLGLAKCTPAPPPSSGMNSIPALSRANRRARASTAVTDTGPSSASASLIIATMMMASLTREPAFRCCAQLVHGAILQSERAALRQLRARGQSDAGPKWVL